MHFSLSASFSFIDCIKLIVKKMILKLFVVLSIWCQEKTTFKKRKTMKEKIYISGYFIQIHNFFFYFLCYNPQRDLLTSIFFFFSTSVETIVHKVVNCERYFLFLLSVSYARHRGGMTGFDFRVFLLVLPLL